MVPMVLVQELDDSQVVGADGSGTCSDSQVEVIVGSVDGLHVVDEGSIIVVD